MEGTKWSLNGVWRKREGRCVLFGGGGGKRREGWTGTAHCVVVTTWEGSGQGSGDQVTRWLRNWKAGGGSQVRLRNGSYRNEQGFLVRRGNPALVALASALRNAPSPGALPADRPGALVALVWKAWVLVGKSKQRSVHKRQTTTSRHPTGVPRGP